MKCWDLVGWRSALVEVQSPVAREEASAEEQSELTRERMDAEKADCQVALGSEVVSWRTLGH